MWHVEELDVVRYRKADLRVPAGGRRREYSNRAVAVAKMQGKRRCGGDRRGAIPFQRSSSEDVRHLRSASGWHD
jgi:hypothetical protein